MLALRLPRSWSSAIEQMRRDARSVGRRLTGNGPSPLVKGVTGREHARQSARAVRTPDTPSKPKVPAALGVRASDQAAGARGNARALSAVRVVRETEDAVTLVLRDLRDQGAKTFDFAPGQFFTVLTTVDGEAVPRNYSASNVPGGDELHLTIKRKAGGKVSPLLCAMQPGAQVCVLGPFGSFVVPSAPASDASARALVLVAGGGGITPLASIARTILATEPESEIALVYANRRSEDVILAAELDRLVVTYGSRLSLVHVLEEAVPGWVGVRGRLDRETSTLVLADLPLASRPGVCFYICGPDGMRDEVLAALEDRGAAATSIFIERFAIGPRPHAPTPHGGSDGNPTELRGTEAEFISLRFNKRTYRANVVPGATVLEAGLAAGAPMPFSCAVGGCGACRVKLVEGNVELEEPNCLSADEREAGYVLACIGRPSGSCVVEVLEVE